MYTHDLNNVYLYENERRNEERRAAAASGYMCGFNKKRKTTFPSPVAVAGILAILIVILRGI
jgi:hypothetical protein